MIEISSVVESLTDIDKLCVQHSDGYVLARFGFVVTLLFEGGATLEKRLACLSVVRDYCERFRDRLTHFQRMDANRLSKIKGLSFLEDYDHKTRAATRPRDEGVDYAVYGFAKGADTDEPAYWNIAASAAGPYELRPTDISSVDIYLPASWVEKAGFEAMIDLVSRWCGMLGPIHGTTSLGTLFNHGTTRSGVLDVAVFPLIKRFPGLDYDDSIRWRLPRRMGTREWHAEPEASE